ncbi:DUF4145 domain-containing protein [Lachnospiraceae bacterium 54-53]
MGTTDNSFWIRIQQGLRESETLMSQKQYNMAMIKARQTLEYMVNYLGEKALIVEGDLADSIDQLFEGRFISQAAKDHYHRIRVLGNKAVHEGDDSPYDANEACQLLSQEVQAFANSFNGGRQSSASARQRPSDVRAVPITSRNTSARNGAPGNQAHGTGAQRNGSSRTAPVRTGERSGAARSSGRPDGTRTGQRPPQRNGNGNGNRQRPATHSRSRRRSKKKGFDAYDLIKPAFIFLILLVLVLVIVKLIPGKNDKKETTASEPSTEMTTEAITTTEAPTEEPEPETEAPKIYTTRSKLNVRSEPSTNSTKLGSLAAGTVVEFVETYDSKWTVIMFEGTQAYVATEFLTISEGETSSGTGETGEGAAGTESTAAAQ